MADIDQEDVIKSAENSNIEKEVETYLGGVRIPREADPIMWWFANKHRLPILVRAARIYLAIPPTSVASERMFSVAGQMLTDRRNRLLPEHTEMLVLVHDNLVKLNFNYY